MNFKDMLEKISTLSEAKEETKTGVKHTAEPGGYGRKVDASGDDENEPKKKRGGQEKDTGPKFDTPKGDIFGRTTGEVPKGKKGTEHSKMKAGDKAEKAAEKAEKKKGLKEWMAIAENTMPGAQLNVKPMPGASQLVDQSGKVIATGPADKIKAMQASAASGEVTLGHGEEMNEEGDKWIKGAIKHPGAFTKKAKSAGMTTKAFANKVLSNKEDYPAKTEKQANLAKTLGKLKEADLPVHDGDMGAGLGAGRSQAAFESKFKQEYRKVLEAKGIKVTEQMLEEGWKSKLAGLGTAAAIGATALGGMMGTQAGTNQYGAEYGAAAGGGGVGGSSFSQLYRAQSQVDAKADAFAKANPEFKQQLQQLRQQVDSKYRDSPMLQMQKQLEGTKALLAKYQASESLEEGAKPDFPDIDNDKNKKESIAKAAEDKKKKKVKEGMEHKLKAAHHEGKAHALGKKGYNCNYDDMEEARMYHEGYKQGLDECYGQAPIQGYVGEENTTDVVDNMASYGARDEIDEVSKGEWLKQQASKPGDTFKAFGQTFHDKDVLETEMAFESWDNQLNSLLEEYDNIQEGMTVSISKGQQNTPDTVSVTAQDGEADQLLGLIKQAGLGLFGGEDKPQIGYGVAQGGEEEAPGAGTEPEQAPDVADGDDMLSLIKKMTGISSSEGPVGTASSDYEEEGSSEEHDHGHDHEDTDEATCNECGMMETDCGCDDKEKVDEVESEDQMTYQMAEDNPPDSGAEEFASMDQEIATDNAAASSHGGAENSNLEEEDLDESYANSADDTFESDIEFMTNVISGGLNGKKTTGQSTIPVVASQTSRLHSGSTTDVSESITDWKALAGIK